MKQTALVSTLVVAAVILAGGPALAGNQGDYDTTFNSPVGFLTMIKDGNQDVSDVVTDSAGAIFVAGIIETTAGSTGYRPFVAKILNSGTYDPTFGNLGVFQIPSDIPANHNLLTVDIGLASDGKIYVSFPSMGGSPASLNFFLARVMQDGSGLDTTFGLLGLTVAAFDMVGGNDPGDDIPSDLIVTNDGKIVVVGSVGRGGGVDTDFGVAQFTSTGANDTSFDGDGKKVAVFDLGGFGVDLPTAVTELVASQKLIVVGNAETAAGDNFAVAVFDFTGSLDTGFDSDGLADYQYEDIGSGLLAVDNRAYAVTTSPSIVKSMGVDTVLIGGVSSDPVALLGTQDMAVLCLDMSGWTCSGFGVGGWALIDFSDNSLFGIGDTNDWALSIKFHQPTNRLTVMGGASQTTGALLNYCSVARLDADTAVMDSSFGTLGKRYFTDADSNGITVGDLDSSNRVVLSTTVYSTPNSTNNIWVGRLQGPETPLFSDDFESSNTTAWDDVQP